MSLTYEQMLKIVSEFELRNPAISQNSSVHGVSLEIAPANSRTDGGLDAYAFEIRVLVSQPLSSAAMQFLPQRHSSTLPGLGTIDWPVHVIDTPPACEEVRQGHAANPTSSGDQGTVGHNFYVQGVGHCMMSNHHVLCPTKPQFR